MSNGAVRGFHGRADESGLQMKLELALRRHTYPECLGPEPVKWELTHTKYVAEQSLCFNFGNFCKVSPVNYLAVEKVKSKIGFFFFLLS